MWKVTTLVPFLIAVACYVDVPCDANQSYDRDRFACTVDTSTVTDAPRCDETRFGTACQGSDECGCDTDYCAVQPGETAGFCTIIGCADSPEACAEGFTCFDVSAVAPDLGSLCVPE